MSLSFFHLDFLIGLTGLDSHDKLQTMSKFKLFRTIKFASRRVASGFTRRVKDSFPAERDLAGRGWAQQLKGIERMGSGLVTMKMG